MTESHQHHHDDSTIMISHFPLVECRASTDINSVTTTTTTTMTTLLHPPPTTSSASSSSLNQQTSPPLEQHKNSNPMLTTANNSQLPITETVGHSPAPSLPQPRESTPSTMLISATDQSANNNLQSSSSSSSSSSSTLISHPSFPLQDHQRVEVIASPCRGSRPYSATPHLQHHDAATMGVSPFVRRTCSSNDLQLSSPTTYGCVSCQPSSPYYNGAFRRQSRSNQRISTPASTSNSHPRDRPSSTSSSFGASASADSLPRRVHCRGVTPSHGNSDVISKQISSDFELPPPAAEQHPGAVDSRRYDDNEFSPLSLSSLPHDDRSLQTLIGGSQVFESNNDDVYDDDGDECLDNHNNNLIIEEIHDINNTSSSSSSLYSSSHLPPFPSPLNHESFLNRALVTSSSRCWSHSIQQLDNCDGSSSPCIPPFDITDSDIGFNTLQACIAIENCSKAEKDENCSFPLLSPSIMQVEEEVINMNVNLLSSLPVELLCVSIFDFLDIREIYRLSSTCIDLYEVINHRSVPSIQERQSQGSDTTATTRDSVSNCCLSSSSLAGVKIDEDFEFNNNNSSSNASEWDLWMDKDNHNNNFSSVDESCTMLLSPGQFLNRPTAFFDPPTLHECSDIDDSNSNDAVDVNDEQQRRNGIFSPSRRRSNTISSSSSSTIQQQQQQQQSNNHHQLLMCHHLTLGGWWNAITPHEDCLLIKFLCRSNLKTIKVDSEFYDCLCRSCTNVRKRSNVQDSQIHGDQQQQQQHNQEMFNNNNSYPHEVPLTFEEVDSQITSSQEQSQDDDDDDESSSSGSGDGGEEHTPQLPLRSRPVDPPVMPSPLLLGGSLEASFLDIGSPFSLASPSLSAFTEVLPTETVRPSRVTPPVSQTPTFPSTSATGDESILRRRPSRRLSQLFPTRQQSNVRRRDNNSSHSTNQNVTNQNNASNTSYRLLPLYVDETSSTASRHQQQLPLSPDRHLRRIAPVSDLEGLLNNNTSRIQHNDNSTTTVNNYTSNDGDDGEMSLEGDASTFNITLMQQVNQRQEQQRREQEQQEHAHDVAIAKQHAAARFFWIFRLMMLSRHSLESIDFGTPNVKYQTICEESSVLPDFPLNLRDLDQRFVFPYLKQLRFGYTIDCRFIVPVVDFCNYPLLQKIEILGLTLHYALGVPQFGIKPTMVFGPQQIFTPTDPTTSDQLLWLPALYNGGTDDALQLQGRGVYVSREYHYEGGFKDGRNDGFGRMTSKCGETYEGLWKNGRRHGQGVVIQSDGKRLEGVWVKDLLLGRGSMQLADGLRYEGEWVNGALEGWGVVSKDGYLLAVGQFLDGRPHGWLVCRSEYFEYPLQNMDTPEALCCNIHDPIEEKDDDVATAEEEVHDDTNHSSDDDVVVPVNDESSTRSVESKSLDQMDCCLDPIIIDANPTAVDQQRWKRGREGDDDVEGRNAKQTRFDQQTTSSANGIRITEEEDSSMDVDHLFDPAVDVLCELDTIDWVGNHDEAILSNNSVQNESIIKSPSLLQRLSVMKGWTSMWKYHTSTIDTHNETFQLLKEPPTIENVFLLNSRLSHQVPGLLPHSERPALEKTLQSVANDGHAQPPEYPSWIESMVSKLNYKGFVIPMSMNETELNLLNAQQQ